MKPKIATIALSRTPHPAIEIGIVVIRMTGGINTRQSSTVTATPIDWAQSIGVAVTVLDCLVLMPPVILITTIPISIAGWGVRESAMVAIFGFISVVQEDAIALSLLFGRIKGKGRLHPLGQR